MSLLLEALKKAELAKQGKKPEDGDQSSALAIELEPMPSQRDGGGHTTTPPVITREELPDISQPLEIFSEDLPSSAQRIEASSASAEPIVEEPPSAPYESAAPAIAAEPVTKPEPRATATAVQSSADARAATDRDAARQLFEVKEVEYNPKRNFYITVGVLIAIGAGYAGYVWWQMQPRYTYNTAAVKEPPKGGPPPVTQPAPVAQTEVTATPAQGAAPAGTPAAAQSTTTAPATAPTAPGPAAAPDSAPVEAKGPANVRRGSGVSSPNSAAPARAAAPRENSQARQAAIAIAPPVLSVDPVIEKGFNAYQGGDFGAAREAFEAALARDPQNRDALLGMAAVDIRARNFEAAEGRYLRLLEIDPRDVHAAAGLASLRGQVDPAQSESRIKTLIATNPDAPNLHFALGNQLARQSRWAEAQAAYFRAYSGDTENADFAFNLAVSLDQLRQKGPALQYYARAITLAATRPASFDVAQAQARIEQLKR